MCTISELQEQDRQLTAKQVSCILSNHGMIDSESVSDYYDNHQPNTLGLYSALDLFLWLGY